MTRFWAEFFIVLAAEAGLVVIAAALAQRFVRSETWRRTIWQASFVGLAILLTCELNGARSTIKGIFARTENVSGLQPARSPAPSSPHIGALASATPDKVPVAMPVLIEKAKQSVTARDQWWPGLLWLAGVVVFVGLAIVRRAFLARFRRQCRPAGDATLLAQIEAMGRQLGIQHHVPVVSSERLVSPIAFGVLRPTICVPTNFSELFSPPEQDAVLLHELAHVAARDSMWLCVADAVLALFWWHPLVWWAQRQLRNTTEAAADETSALLANGPKVLAGCLVTLGTRFTDNAGFKALGIHGVRFRSGLGRRVQRLFTLSDTRWTAPAVWRSRVTQFCVPTICVATILGCGAWATTSKGETMKTWKQSLAGLAAVSLLQTLQAEPGAKPADPSILAKTPTKSAPASKPSDVSAGSKRQALPPITTAETMRNHLSTIILDTVVYDGLPLGEVVRQLTEEAARRHPSKRGVNFIFGKPRFQQTVIDPATGLPIKGQVEPVDLASTTIRITPPIQNVRLIDLLEIITKVADRPIEYTIHEYGVVFAEAPGPGEQVIPAGVPTITRVFNVDANTFLSGIKKTFGIEIETESAEYVRAGLGQLLAILGVDMKAPNRAVFYNDVNGTLLVRASEEEMVVINGAMETLGAKPPAK